MKNNFLTLLFLIFSVGVLAGVPDAKISHENWDKLLQANVSESGDVNYEGFKSSIAKLDQYLSSLSKASPKSDWSRNEKLAYWINAYNAFTIKLILNNYPLTSIQEINGGKAWDLKFIEIEGSKYSLNQIENEIIRPQFKEPRIHFAVNCAAKSCPKLNNQAFMPSDLDRQLEKMTVEFVNNSQKNQLKEQSISISKIFDWYKQDFTANGTLIDFLNKYSEVKIASSASVSFKDYNWELNK